MLRGGPAQAQYNRVWIPDPKEVWQSAEIAQEYSTGDKVLHLRLEDGTELDYPSEPGPLPPLRNPDILVGENDLTALSYLHEPAVLHNLRVRFAEARLIYTYSGIILVAMNPYKQLPIYGDAIIHAYSGQNMGDMDPHIFAVAEEAYKQMARNNRNQSVIVSGESGAGKTVSARYAMRYFATVSRSSSDAQVEDRVLASNPITEAIGNAKTTRNDNSSRFGKYTEISFNERNQIIGANMRTYLLEKSRVVFQSENERNYHIFYQLCASGQRSEFRHLKLGRAEEFHYTNMGGNAVIEGVDDRVDLVETQKTFKLLGFREDFQLDVFTVLAAILHLGNVQVTAAGTERSSVREDDGHLQVFCELLGLQCGQVAQWLCHRKIITSSETVVKPMTRPQAINARDALAKKIYAHLFDFVVDRINGALGFSGRRHSFIGVLDIYGFETFDVNSFEQFCINYANEKLQQQFNLGPPGARSRRTGPRWVPGYAAGDRGWPWRWGPTQTHIRVTAWSLGGVTCTPNVGAEALSAGLFGAHRNDHSSSCSPRHQHVFKLEQEEYMKEDVPWTLIDFYDNRPVIDLIEAKMGILELLDEECLLPHGTDENWLQKLYNNFVNKNSLFEKPRMSNTSFIIQHFADKVEYECEGFLEKNRDTVHDTLVDIMRTSKITVKPAKQVVKPSSKHLRTSVGSKFRSSLALLMETLNTTTPHYVRCIKPNDQKLPFEFDSKRVVQQLRACGVLETIRISAQSYPSRWTYIEFYGRYGILMTRQELAAGDRKRVCQVVLRRLIQDWNQYQFGKTKIFFRAGQVAYLEKLRLDKLRQSCVVIQKRVRGWLQRRRFLHTRHAALVIQRYFRGQQSVRKAVTAQALKEAWAAIVLQRHCRGYLVRSLYQLILMAAITIQAHARGFLARRRYRKMLEEHKAVILQKYARAWLARRRFQSIRRLVLNIQLAYRVQRLQKKLEDQNRENHGLVEKLTSLASLRASDTLKVQKLEAELQRAAAQQHSAEDKDRRYREAVEQKLATLQKHNSELEMQKEQIQLKLQEKTQELEGKDQGGPEIHVQGGPVMLAVEEFTRQGQHGDECGPSQVLSRGSRCQLTVSRDVTLMGQGCRAIMAVDWPQPEKMDNLTKQLFDDVQREERQRTLLEKSFELKAQDYEKQLQSLREEIRAVQQEKAQLRQELEEERVAGDSLKGEVARLSQQAKTISEFEKEIELLQMQKIDVEKLVQSQKREMREKMSEVTRQLLESYDIEDMRSRLSEEDLGHLNEDGELWFAYEGLKKATRVLESHFQSQKDNYEKEIEALNAKVVHLSQEINHLQKLFREESNVHENVRHELTRLMSENMMIPDFKQQISELEKQRQDLEIRLQEQTETVKGKPEELWSLLCGDEEEGMQKAQNERDTKMEERLMGSVPGRQEAGEQPKEPSETEGEESRVPLENRDLEEELDMKDRVIKKLQDQVKTLTKTIETAQDAHPSSEAKEYLGMLQYQREDEARLIQNLILEGLGDAAVALCPDIWGHPLAGFVVGRPHYDSVELASLAEPFLRDPSALRPTLSPAQASQAPLQPGHPSRAVSRANLKPRGVVVNMMPGLPAHLLLMCVRYADAQNDAAMVRSLMNSTISAIKQVVKEHLEDFEMLSFWLSNTCHFLNCLKQYSGEEEFMKHNSPHQNENCLKNFDLSEYRQILSDVAIRIYHQFIVVMENNIQPIIVPGMLEYESLQGLSGLKPTGFRKRSSSIDDTDAYTMTSVLQQLSYFYSTMCQSGLDAELVRQVAKQLFYLIGAVTLNSLFLRKDMCSCRKGMQIRCNISYLEEWLKDKNLQTSTARGTLEPLSQAAWLLQVKKTTDSDAKEIAEHCPSLSAVQIIKILNSYTPIDDFEKRVTPSFVRKVQSQCGSTGTVLTRPQLSFQALLSGREDSAQLMLDTKYLFPVTFPFSASPHALELLQIPSSFKLGFLRRL
ncbi:Myosin-Vc [Heterocephalus glaber]|uniref:Myosin-Vc n=1 Tax=Heterocephalus glaber TaxID=10181 RepID=G5C9D2_HETGA|nr:Myosin-Vc [Heterocephalus glaber]